ncbi:unnamed protein product [Dracunculus medinensis]|uniref:Apple domain-containing protein n=1 Tax=Dracunculus medinensis TaxID=318479 RepID=A0A3P7PQ65_DRAME|nr:unnamed protein product [Dracunculus medinensis]
MKPCFERYLGFKLSNAKPYHSEWRMKTAEDCLHFCALSLSRCRSVVYDKFLHVCHYIPGGSGEENLEHDSRMIFFKISGRDCPAFSYFDAERECILHINNAASIESLNLIPSPTTNFNSRTQMKFCFPGEFFFLRKVFMAFHDFTLTVWPREQYNGLPEGRAGLQACIELCILSSEFYCKSASFIIKQGKCILRDENSVTMPKEFRENYDPNELYFENGCNHKQISNFFSNFHFLFQNSNIRFSFFLVLLHLILLLV